MQNNIESKNILLLSAGRRVELIQEFKKAAQRLNINSKIIAADISNTAPAIYFADKYYIIPRIGSENYIQEIISICIKEQISLVIPTIDTELLVLSENKQNIQNQTKAKVLVSNCDVINICRNKINTHKFFEENGFGVPRKISIDDEIINFPVFIKPKDGSSSINTFKVNNIEELNFFNKYINEPIIQEFIEGEEYTVDAFLDFESNVISIVPRRRLATRSGEIVKGKIIKDREIIEDVKKILNVLKPIGQITIQCMKVKNGIKYIEINPRFGGGAPMSIKAGANSCENLYRILRNEKLIYNENYKENITFLRFDSAIMLNDNMKIIND